MCFELSIVGAAVLVFGELCVPLECQVWGRRRREGGLSEWEAHCAMSGSQLARERKQTPG